MQLSLDCSFWYFLSIGSELDIQLVSENSTSSMWHGYQKSYYFGPWQYIAKTFSSQCNLTAQIEQVQDKSYFYTHVLHGILDLRPIVGYILPTYDTYYQYNISMYGQVLQNNSGYLSLISFDLRYHFVCDIWGCNYNPNIFLLWILELCRLVPFDTLEFFTSVQSWLIV